MDFLRRQWLGIALLLAICVSFGFTLGQARTDTAQVRTKAIEICTKGSTAQALIVAFKLRVSEEYRREGKKDTAAYTAALARSGLALVPLAPEDEKLRNTLTKVAREGSHYDLLPAAKKTMAHGCTVAYDPK